MNKPGSIGRGLTISIISAAVAFSPLLLFEIGSEAGTTGEGAYVIFFLVTVPLGLALFIIGNSLNIWSAKIYADSLPDSEKKELFSNLRRDWALLAFILFLLFFVIPTVVDIYDYYF